MSNMSYCRFQNTLADLEDCEKALCELIDSAKELSKEELWAARALVDVCIAIAHEFPEGL